MSALTIENSVNNLEKFIADINNQSNNYYFFIGKPTAWSDDTAPPEANTSYQEMFETYHDMICGKVITASNISPLIANIPWVSGVVYPQYDINNDDLMNVNFYVVTPDMSVYKCIDNNNGAASTIIPSLRLTDGDFFESSDGYTWKFMFTVPPAANNTFTTNQFIPLVPNNSVVESAVPGTIDAYRLTSKGSNYQGFEEGMIQNVISPSSIQLDTNAVAIDHFYEGCSLYLKSGLGAGQISNILTYQGDSRTAYISPPFNTFLNMSLNTVTGVFNLGDIVQQKIDYVSYLYGEGFFNVGDQVIQSDSNNISGNVATSNSSLMTIINLNNGANNFGVGANGYPIYNARNAGSLLTGNVTISVGANQITATTANFTTLGLTTGQFIRVGSDANNNIRRITSVSSSSVANVDLPFNNNLVGVNFYLVPDAVTPISEVITTSKGIITDTNLNSIIMNYNNMSVPGQSFTVGEMIKEYDVHGADLGANGIISFTNTSTVILSALNGTMLIGEKIVGQTSNLSATIASVISYPNITLTDMSGPFYIGFPVQDYSSPTVVSGAGIPIALLEIPSDDVQYIVSPKVTITGDGVNAAAYCIVNNAIGSIYEITKVIPINVGEYFTYADVTISGATGYGSGATAIPVISPTGGHGSDPLSELGARYAGISMTFDTAINENYKLPNYGTYRKTGIIFDPLFNDVFFNVTSTLRNNLKVISPTGAFATNEIVLQSNTNAAGVVVFSNSSTIQMKNICGTFSNSAANVQLIGLTSGSVANIVSHDTLSFVVNGLGDQTLYNEQTDASFTLSQVISPTLLRGSNVSGQFNLGDTIYDPLSNSYASIISIYGANNTVNLGSTYGSKFNQTSRIPLTSYSKSFTVGETVTQTISGSRGYVLDTTHELDFTYNLSSGTISLGSILTDSTSAANGIVTFANSSYIKLTGVQGQFNATDDITSITGYGTVGVVYPVIVLSDVLTPFDEGPEYVITGPTSGAIAVNLIPNTITSPDLVKNSGSILYINNIKPFTIDLGTKESFNLVLGF